MSKFLRSSGDLAAGSAALSWVRQFKGVVIVDQTGDADVVVWKGEDNTGVELARARASDEHQMGQVWIPGDLTIPTPAGVNYTITGASAVAIIYGESGPATGNPI